MSVIEKSRSDLRKLRTRGGQEADNNKNLLSENMVKNRAQNRVSDVSDMSDKRIRMIIGRHQGGNFSFKPLLLAQKQKPKIKQSPFKFKDRMEQLRISFCYECKTWSYRYNFQRCPVCLDMERQKENVN
jgi:hypothetical protein